MTSGAWLEDLAQRAVALAVQRGATGAESIVLAGDEFEVSVRLGEIETLKEAGARGAGLRVLLGRKAGSAYTSDLSADGIRRMVDSAIGLAQISTEDPHAGLPEESDQGKLDTELELYSESIPALNPARRIEMAREAEQAALGSDPRITNSEGAAYSSYTGWRAFANSSGFVGSYRSSSCSLHVTPVAVENGRRERDYWHCSARRLDRLESPETVGRKAAERVVRRLGARKIATRKVPVLLEPRTARSIIGHIFSAVAGESIYHQSSFLLDKLGEQVASPLVTVIDDGTLPGLFGTSPFDDEGVRSRRTTVMEEGVLRSYLLNSYAARKLGLRTTGNASRGIAGNASTGTGNLFLANGSTAPEEMIRSLSKGLLVTELLGSGVNIVNGDYSRGAAGMWIENGELAFPLHEITIAGNLRDMLMRIEAVGNDLEFRGSVVSPTILIGEMTVSGT